MSLVWKAVHYYPQVLSIITKLGWLYFRMLPESVVIALMQAFISCLKYSKNFLTAFALLTLSPEMYPAMPQDNGVRIK